MAFVYFSHLILKALTIMKKKKHQCFEQIKTLVTLLLKLMIKTYRSITPLSLNNIIHIKSY
jgi:hypothetical protein